MRRAIKELNSIVVVKQLTAKKACEALLAEQKGFCAYTDEYISRTDAVDLEHFNPTLKDTDGDNYNNWFAVKHQWNSEKSTKWEKFQPILHPSAIDFEDRIVYRNGDYLAASDTDIEANNLVKLLKLDDLALADKRKRYIKRKKEEVSIYGESPEEFFGTLVDDDICQVHYPRAIKEEFNVDVWDIIPG